VILYIYIDNEIKTMMTVEVEIKALVKDINGLREKISTNYDLSRCSIKHSTQKNHYFDGDKNSLALLLQSEVLCRSEEIKSKLKKHKEELINADRLAVRTRHDSIKGNILIFKYSLTDESVTNGVTREELELEIDGYVLATLDDLDNHLLSIGYILQSKWSRERTQYNFDSGWSLCLDNNAGFGGILEVEYMTTKEEYNSKKDYLLYKANNFLSTLGLEKVETDTLNKMFDFYSSKYNHFYGTNLLIWDDSDLEPLCTNHESTKNM
jgi:adenylate cyclase class IV